MPIPQTTCDQVERLVAKFKALPPRARQAYNEDNTRKDFILPLFHALEWNTTDAREVTAEEKISRGYVDFAFRIGGIPRLMLETKRVGENLNDPRWAQQAIDYAYHKDVTWALLSDFEGLKILNAEAKEADPFRAMFKEFGVDDYLPRLDELWLLSRPAMADGALDREAERVFKKIPKTPITQSLFDNLTKWRADLYKNLRAYNKTRSDKDIDDAVQRILDRLIFIRTAEDRGVEGDKLRALVRELRDQNRLNDLIPALSRRFRALDAIYNSQLFAPHLCEDLTYEPTTLVNIVEELYGAETGIVRYNFAFIDADVLGRAYEQYLGTSRGVLLNAPRKGVLLNAPTKRKSQGIYYTPTFVVKYIVQQTLGRYLDERGYNPAQPVRVLDPACGSGSFLIEAFDVLDMYLARERGQDRPIPPTPFPHREGGEGVRYDAHDHARQMQILTQNIYGVDKDAQAVEVAQLNLLLKALHLREKLPKLDNVRCGDSLISGTPKELEQFFGAHAEEKNAFNWEREFQRVMADGGFDVIVGNPPYVRQETLGEEFKAYAREKFATYAGTADLYTYFIERAMSLLKPGGLFGFIVANKWMRANYGEPLRRWLKQQCIEEIIDFGDLPVFQQATTYPCILILRKDAPRQTFSVAKVETLEFDNLANYAREHQHPMTQTALDDTGWSLAEAQAQTLLDKIRDAGVPLGEYVDGKIFFGIKTGANDAFIIDTKTCAKLIAEDRKSKAVIKPFLLGRDVSRYQIQATDRHLIFTRRGIKIKDYPAVRKYLTTFKSRLIPKPSDWKGGDWQGRKVGTYEWYEIQDAVDYFAEFEKPKIIAPTIVNRASFAFDKQGLYSNDKTSIIVSGDLYLLGVLNSRVVDFVMRNISSTKQGGYFEQKPMYIEQLPIRRINFADAVEKQQHDAIVAFVEEMLELQKEYAVASREKLPRADALKRKIDAVDAEIDAAVYRLYDLSEEEIRVVEGKDK